MSLATFALLGRLLGPEAFGIVAAAQVVIMLLGVFANSGVVQALVLEHELDAQTRAGGLWLGLTAGALPAVALLAGAPVVASIFQIPELAPVLQVMSIYLLLRGLSVVPEALLLKDLRFRAIAVRSVVSTLGGALAGITLALLGAGVWALVIQTITQATLALAIMWASAGVGPTFATSKTTVLRLGRVGYKLLGVELVTVVLHYGDNFVVGALLGAEALGYYVIAFRLLTVLQDSFTGVLDALSLPIFARLRDDAQRTADAVAAASKLSLAGAVPLFLGLFISAPQIVPALFGAEWAPSVVLVQWLCVAGIATSVNFFNRSVLYAAGRPDLELLVVGVAALLTIAGAVMGAGYGLTAVAAAIAVRSVLTWPLRLLTLRKAIGMDIGSLIRGWRQPLLGGALLLASAEAVNVLLPLGHGLVHVASALLVGFTAYIALLYLCDRPFVRLASDLVKSVRR